MHYHSVVIVDSGDFVWLVFECETSIDEILRSDYRPNTQHIYHACYKVKCRLAEMYADPE